MFIITHDHTSGKDHFSSKDTKHAYVCKLGNFDFSERGLRVEFVFTPALPIYGHIGRKVVSLSDTFNVDVTRNEFNEIRARILAHKVISWNIVNNIIEDVKGGK